MGFWEDAGNFLGEATGVNAAGRQREQDKIAKRQAKYDKYARQRQLEAQKRMLETDVNITAEDRATQNQAAQEMAQKQAAFADAQAQQDAQRAQMMATQNAQRAGRTAGLNPAQAAMLAQDQGGQIYNQQLISGRQAQAQNYLGQQGVAAQQAAAQTAAQAQEQGMQLDALRGAAGVGTTGAGYTNTDALGGIKAAAGLIGGLTGTVAGGGSGAAGNVAAAPGAGASAGVAPGTAAPTRGNVAMAPGSTPPSRAVSDENLKEDIQEVGSPTEVFKEVPAVTFNYTPESGEDTAPNRIGVLAQDLEKTPLRYTVENTPKGKVVNTPQLTMANTAAIADLARKLDRAMAYYKEMI